MEETLYLLTLEALNNALKHAAADKVTVWLRAKNSHLELEVMDNGRGFDPRQAGRRRGGVGLASMRERAARVDGLFSLHSAPGKGTRIKVVCPIPEPSDQTRPDQTRPDQTRPENGSRVY